MSVFVKGMNMPRSCWECNLHCFRDNGFRDKEEIQWGPITIIPEDFRCGGNNEWHETNEFDFLNERHPDCPLVEVPTPHGRLIDADELLKVIEENSYRLRSVINSTENGMFLSGIRQAIDESPTIIEAENSSAIDDDVKKYCDYLKSETYDFCNRIENGEVNE